MDNLQREYLLRLMAAQEKILAGNIKDCLEECFELRLKPDLALYTRALVCLTIGDLVNLEDVPDKLDLAAEALRLAIELKVSTFSRSSSSFRPPALLSSALVYLRFNLGSRVRIEYSVS